MGHDLSQDAEIWDDAYKLTSEPVREYLKKRAESRKSE